MKFKIIYEHKLCEFKTSIKPDECPDIILPKDTTQHVYFPIPKSLTKKIQKIIRNEIDVELNVKFEHFKDVGLGDRLFMIQKIREEYNTKIMSICEKFELDHAEYFI